MPLALSELFVTLSARTAGLDNAIASTHAKMGALSTQFGRTRDANGRFVAGMGGGAAAISRAGGSFSGFSAGLAGIQKGMGGAATAVGTFAGNVASRLAALAAPAVGDLLGGTAIDFERRFAGLAKATDLAGPGLAAMKAEIYGLATGLKGVSVEDLIDIATTGAKMGVSADGLAKWTEGIAKASTAVDDMSALELAESMGKINSVFALGAEGPAQLASAFDKLADSGISSLGGISNVVGRLSGTAKAAGLSAAETGALASALLDTGSNAELGATSIQRLIVALNDAGSQGAFAKVLGVSVEEFGAKVRASPIQAIQDFLKALNTLDAGSQTLALGAIGVEGIQASGELQKLAAQHEIVARNIGLANHEMATQDQLTKSYNTTAALTSSALDQANNRYKIAADTIGTQMLPVIIQATEAFGGLATALGKATAGDIAGSEEADGGFVVGLVSALAGVPERFEIMRIRAQDSLLGMGDAFLGLKDMAVAVFTFVGEFASNLFERMTANIRNLFNGLGTVFENIVTGNVGDIFSGKLKSPLEGFRPEVGVENLIPEFRAPGPRAPRVDPRIAGLESFIRGIDDPKAAAEAIKAAALPIGAAAAEAAVAFVGPPKPAPFVGPPRPDGLTAEAVAKGTFAPAADKAKKTADAFQSQSFAAADFATKFRQAQFTGKDKDAEARKEAELNRIALKENTKALQQQMKGFGLA